MISPVGPFRELLDPIMAEGHIVEKWIRAAQFSVDSLGDHDLVIQVVLALVHREKVDRDDN